MTAALTLLSAGEAQRLTQRIKSTASVVRDGLFKLRNLVDEAKASNTWQVLGFSSWTAYLADTLGSEPMRVGKAQQQELLEYLSGEGLSLRAISAITELPKSTVSDNLAGVRNRTPEPDFDPTPTLAPRSDDWSEPVAVNPATGEVIDAPVTTTETHTLKTVIGLDGKNYTQAPKEPRRSSLIDDARNAGWQLRKAIERLQRIESDDRFRKNKVEIAAALQPHLDFASEVIAGLNTTTELEN